MNAGTNLLTIPYPEDLLLSLKESKSDFEAEAKLLLAVKLYEMGRVSTGMADACGWHGPGAVYVYVGPVRTFTHRRRRCRVGAGPGQCLRHSYGSSATRHLSLRCL